MVRQRTVEDAVKKARGLRLCERRRKLLGAKGRRLSQKELGAMVGVSGAQISKYELGDDLVDAEKAHRFAKALRCRFLDIFVPGRLELAEDAAMFRFAGEDELHSHPEDELAVLIDNAKAALSSERRFILRDVILELMAAEETAPRVAPRRGIL